jgi:hypothetical protein
LQDRKRGQQHQQHEGDERQTRWSTSLPSWHGSGQSEDHGLECNTREISATR